MKFCMSQKIRINKPVSVELQNKDLDLDLDLDLDGHGSFKIVAGVGAVSASLAFV